MAFTEVCWEMVFSKFPWKLYVRNSRLRPHSLFPDLFLGECDFPLQFSSQMLVMTFIYAKREDLLDELETN